MRAKHNYIFLVITLSLALAILLFIKTALFGRFTPDWDESHHLLMAYRFYRAATEGNIFWFKDLLLNSHQIYPPLYHIVSAISFWLFGVVTVAGVYANIPFIFLLTFSLYKLLDKLIGSKPALFTAVLTPILPMFLSLQERASIDYASVSMFLCSFYLLFETKHFTNRRYSVLFGISISLNLLTKWPFVIPSIPFLIYLIEGFLKSPEKSKTMINNVFLIILLAVPGFIWYLFNYKYIIDGLAFFWDPDGYAQQLWANPVLFSVDNFLFYIYYTMVGAVGAGLIPTIFIYAAVALTIINFKKNTKSFYLMFSIVITYSVLTYLNDKSGYYFAYSIPIFLALTFKQLFDIRNTTIRYVLIGTLSLSIVANFTLAQYNIVERKTAFFNIGAATVTVFPNYATKFTHDKWPTKSIAQDYLSVNCNRKILVFPDNRLLNASNIRYFLEVGYHNLEVTSAQVLYNPATDKTFDMKRLTKYDCIISKTDRPGVFANTEVLESVINYLKEQPTYSSTKFYPPDGSEIYVFTKDHAQNI